jgi:hypothetical protein
MTLNDALAWLRSIGFAVSRGPREGEITLVNGEVTAVWPEEEVVPIVELASGIHLRNSGGGYDA